MYDSDNTLSGLTEDEAKEFHNMYMAGFIGLLVICIIAHWMVWTWRPWIPGAEGYATADIIQNASAYLSMLG